MHYGHLMLKYQKYILSHVLQKKRLHNTYLVAAYKLMVYTFCFLKKLPALQ